MSDSSERTHMTLLYWFRRFLRIFTVSNSASGPGVRVRPIVFPSVAAGIFALSGFLAWIAVRDSLDVLATGAVFLLGLIAGLLTLRGSTWIFATSPAFFGLATLLLGSRPVTGRFDSIWFISAMIVGAAHSLFAIKPCWSVLLRPQLRWWRSARRIPIVIRTRVSPATGGEFVTCTAEISQTGAFLSLEPAQLRSGKRIGNVSYTPVDPVSEIKVGVHCSVRLELNQYTAFNCLVRVARREETARGTYGVGFGVVFVGLTGKQKRVLARYLKAVAAERSPAGLKNPVAA